jgi:hypothetical protein
MREVTSTTVKAAKGDQGITVSIDGRFPLFPKADPNWGGSIAINTSRLDGEMVVSVLPDYERKIWTRNHEEGGWSERYYAVPLKASKADIVRTLFEGDTLQLIANVENGRPSDDPHNPLSPEAFEADMLLRQRLLSIPSA